MGSFAAFRDERILRGGQPAQIILAQPRFALPAVALLESEPQGLPRALAKLETAEGRLIRRGGEKPRLAPRAPAVF
jgi:hypothetical protein